MMTQASEIGAHKKSGGGVGTSGSLLRTFDAGADQDALWTPRTADDRAPSAPEASGAVVGRVADCQIGWLYHNDGRTRALGCRKWTCPQCGPRNARAWIMRVKEEPADRLITQTLEGDGRPTRENFSRLARGWWFVRRWLRKQGAAIHVTWVREQGERGTRRIHQHCLIDGKTKIDLRRLRQVAVRHGLGRFINVRRLKSAHHARRYIAKYLFKATNQSWPRYTRRVQTTAKRPLPEPGWHCALFTRPWPSAPNVLRMSDVWVAERLGLRTLTLIKEEKLDTSSALQRETVS